ncbi:MAG TPA: asparagine synthase (glutamine-hydrolyzing), partial [Caulobacteraceae bacterium]|nr:asparagine synthase (glutamine-hydrolyzing) [Caulobacteraceae bacterium]
MCGITGIFASGGRTPIDLRLLDRMCKVIERRGPDGSGVWIDSEAGIGLGHTRLAIIDLSEMGAQPMASHSGRFVISFNGEIFNFGALRGELEDSGLAPNWRGHSDTEVLLAAIDGWGFEGALERIEGQFAMALWDRRARSLHLARDRFGEKPLYYGWAGSSLVFGSELKTFCAHPDFVREIDQEALAGYARYGFVPHPRSIWRGVAKLPPGAVVAFAADDKPGHMPPPRQYWDAGEAAAKAMGDPWRGSAGEAEEALEALLRKTVSQRMISDAPLGALLSGGVDSSAVVSMMQAHSPGVKTFTIGSPEPGFDEAVHARRVAEHLQTDHTELYVGPAEVVAVAPKLAEIYDEPFADPSQIPTYLVSKLAGAQVKVVLSGDGGDEVFGGYNRYTHGAAIWRKVGAAPHAVRSLLAAGAGALSPQTWNRVTGALAPLLPAELSDGRAGEKLHKLAAVLAAPNEAAYHQSLLSLWDEPSRLVRSGARGLALPGDHPWPAGMSGFAQRAMYLDTCYYLPDDVLVKVDRASMAASVEARTPFLDREVFDFAWRLPMAMKISNGRGKQILRDVLYRHVPRELIDRPKQGFALPIGRWLRQDLREWGEALLEPRRLEAQGLFDAAVV